MTPLNPVVSVMLPFRNGGKLFPAAVCSILQQSFQDFELLLCDDGSVDGSLEWARNLNDPRVRVWSDGKSMGLAARLNECIDRADGIFLARMDADDISYPDRLQRQVNFLEWHSEVDLVGCQVIVFGEEGQALARRSFPLTHAGITASPATNFGIVHPTWMARQAWFRQHRYDPKAIRFEDVELLLRSYKTSRFANLPEILHGYQEPRGGLAKRYRSRVGRIRYLKTQQSTLGTALYRKAALAEAFKLPADAAMTLLGMRYAMLKAREGQLSPSDCATWEGIFTRFAEWNQPPERVVTKSALIAKQ